MAPSAPPPVGSSSSSSSSGCRFDPLTTTATSSPGRGGLLREVRWVRVLLLLLLWLLLWSAPAPVVHPFTIQSVASLPSFSTRWPPCGSSSTSSRRTMESTPWRRRRRRLCLRNHVDDDDDDHPNPDRDHAGSRTTTVGNWATNPLPDHDRPGHHVVTGGDYVGFGVTLEIQSSSLSTSGVVVLLMVGRLCPVPDRLVPAAMVEWGQVPYTLEMLTSEDPGPAVDPPPPPHHHHHNHHHHQLNEEVLPPLSSAEVDAASSSSSWTRQTLTVLPETGCGVDNLETVKTNESIPWSSLSSYGGQHVQSNLYEKKSTSPEPSSRLVAQREDPSLWSSPSPLLITSRDWRLETIFDLGSSSADDHNTHSPDTRHDLAAGHRVRIAVDLSVSLWGHNRTVQSLRLRGPSQETRLLLSVVWERQLNTVSSRGTLNDGGGLDAQRLYRWMGPTLIQWQKQLEKQGSQPSNSPAHNNQWEAEQGASTPAAVLPGNVTLTVGSGPYPPRPKGVQGQDEDGADAAGYWYWVDVGLVYPERGLRHVARRCFRQGHSTWSDHEMISWWEPGHLLRPPPRVE